MADIRKTYRIRKPGTPSTWWDGEKWGRGWNEYATREEAEAEVESVRRSDINAIRGIVIEVEHCGYAPDFTR